MSDLWNKEPVYVVMADNGETWEDYRERRLGIFKKKEDAELYLTNVGWKKGKKYWLKLEDIYGYEAECHAWIEEDELTF